MHTPYASKLKDRFSRSKGSADAEHGDEECDIFNETRFNELLTFERRRTERSRRPFILMLADIQGCSGGVNGRDPRRGVIAAIVACTRETDIVGWYQHHHVLGVLFTEIGDSGPAVAKEKIRERIAASLEAELGTERFCQLLVTFHAYPEEGKGEGVVDANELKLYPDIVKNESLKRVSFGAKRAVDILGSIVALIFLSPLFFAISVWIKATSTGPVLFRQERVGQFGRRFIFLKFRSMYVDNDPAIHKDFIKSLITRPPQATESPCEGEAFFKIRNDPRVTPVGRIIRKTSMDEFPQFFNVLRGDMSLVGPRPPIPYELEHYDIWHRRRILEMKPGITGPWQVKGRSRTTFDEMVRMDIRYIEQWSLWMDLKLLLMTPYVILCGKGAC